MRDFVLTWFFSYRRKSLVNILLGLQGNNIFGHEL